MHTSFAITGRITIRRFNLRKIGYNSATVIGNGRRSVAARGVAQGGVGLHSDGFEAMIQINQKPKHPWSRYQDDPDDGVPILRLRFRDQEVEAEEEAAGDDAEEHQTGDDQNSCIPFSFFHEMRLICYGELLIPWIQIFILLSFGKQIQWKEGFQTLQSWFVGTL